MSKRAKAPEFVASHLFAGPERPNDPGGIGPYTADRFEFRGYVLRKRNLWSRRIQEWHSRETSISAAGPGDEPFPWAASGWTARVTIVEGEGATLLEALEDAWAGAAFEGQLHNLVPPDPPEAAP